MNYRFVFQQELTSPRLIKSHLPYRFLPTALHNGEAKVSPVQESTHAAEMTFIALICYFGEFLSYKCSQSQPKCMICNINPSVRAQRLQHWSYQACISNCPHTSQSPALCWPPADLQ